MTEPVAYLAKSRTTDSVLASIHEFNPNGFENIPLYTSEQLHPRVKMTKEQYKEWQSAISSIYPVNLYELFNLIFNPAEHHGEYSGMRDIFSFDEGQKKLAQLWSDFDPFNPEETIEIVPNMKWFVRSKEVQSEDDYFYLINPGQLFPLFTTNIERAGSFSTKEEAENWTNPLTEAVQLPVEDE